MRNYLTFVLENRRFLAYGLLFTMTSSVGHTYFIGLFGAEIRAEFALSHGSFGSIYSLATLGSGLAVIWLGRKIDDVDLRHYTAMVCAGLVAACFFLALAPTAVRARPGFIARVLRFALPVGTLAAAATYAAYELAIAEGVTLLRARTLATLVLVSVGLFALVLNSRPLTPGRRVLVGTMAAIFGLIVVTPAWRVFFELELPRLVVVLAGIGIIGITGGVMYGALRAFGWLKQVPTLLRTRFEPQRAGGILAGLRRFTRRTQPSVESASD